MTNKEAQQMFNEEYLKAQKEQLFPQEQLPEGYNRWKIAAFNFVNMALVRNNYRMSWQEYKVLLMKEKDYTLYEIFVTNSILELCTPNDMQKLIEENFFDVQDRVIQVNKVFTDIMKPVEEAIMRKIEIMSNQKGAYKEPNGLRFIR